MGRVTTTTDPNTDNHVRYDINVDNIFLSFPNQQKKFTFVNGTASERTIKAGTLVGITTADQTIAQPVESDASDGSEVPYGFLLYDVTIDAGATEEVEALVGYGDDKSSIFADKITLEKTGDTLDTVITQLGISIRAAIQAYCLVRVQSSATDVSGYKDEQV